MTSKLQNALNEQITAELWSANLYLSMSFYMKKEGYDVEFLEFHGLHLIHPPVVEKAMEFFINRSPGRPQ